MSMFINPSQTVEIEDVRETGDKMTIKARMDFDSYALVEDKMMRLRLNQTKGNVKKAAEMQIDAHMTTSAQQKALLQENVKAWSGPSFVDGREKPIPCTRANVGMLNPVDPFVIQVLEEIDRRNSPPDVSDVPGQAAQNGEDPTIASTAAISE